MDSRFSFTCTLKTVVPCISHFKVSPLKKIGLSQKPTRIGMIKARQRVGLRAGPKKKSKIIYIFFFLRFLKNKYKFIFIFLVLLLKTVHFIQKKKNIFFAKSFSDKPIFFHGLHFRLHLFSAKIKTQNVLYKCASMEQKSLKLQ